MSRSVPSQETHNRRERGKKQSATELQHEKIYTSPNDARAVQTMRSRLTLRVLSSGKIAPASALGLCAPGDHRRINGWVRVKINFWSNRAAMLVSSKLERSHNQPDNGGHDDVLRGASC